MAAEICKSNHSILSLLRRFNEAAANGRGNLPRRIERAHEVRASMRPRRMAAEIGRIVYFRCSTPSGLQ